MGKMKMSHEEFILDLLKNTDANGRIKCRERNDLEYKESFNSSNFAKYAKTMASFANNCGGYIVFGIKDNPREIKGVNGAFNNFDQEKFTECLNSVFSPEIIWSSGIVEHGGISVGYIYTAESFEKPVIALKNDNGEKISSGDVFYRYRGRSEKIKYSEMKRIIDENKKKEQERILKLVEEIKNSDTTNIGIINYKSGHFSTPYGVDVEIDKKLVMQVLRKARYIKSGEFEEKNGSPVIKVTGDIYLAEEVPVPDLDTDVHYHYFEKDLIEKTGLSQTAIRALIFHFDLKKQKKFHQETTTSRTGGKTHKYSDVALQFLVDEINKHKNDEDWLPDLVADYKERGIRKNKSTGDGNGK